MLVFHMAQLNLCQTAGLCNNCLEDFDMLGSTIFRRLLHSCSQCCFETLVKDATNNNRLNIIIAFMGSSLPEPQSAGIAIIELLHVFSTLVPLCDSGFYLVFSVLLLHPDSQHKKAHPQACVCWVVGFTVQQVPFSMWGRKPQPQWQQQRLYFQPAWSWDFVLFLFKSFPFLSLFFNSNLRVFVDINYLTCSIKKKSWRN